MTGRGARAIHEGVKTLRLTLISALSAVLAGPVIGQEPGGAPQAAPVIQKAPREVILSAVKAVEDLGDQVVQGRYQVAIERMNPLWKKRTAARIGGMRALERQLAAVSEEMVRQGISMVSFKPVGTPQSFEVWPGKKVDPATGAETLIYTKWMVMVPTATRFRIFRKGEAKSRTIESIGFQVAVSDKDKNEWTFIDGSSLSLNDLRSLFINLPQDLELPPLDRREVTP